MPCSITHWFAQGFFSLSFLHASPANSLDWTRRTSPDKDKVSIFRFFSLVRRAGFLSVDKWAHTISVSEQECLMLRPFLFTSFLRLSIAKKKMIKFSWLLTIRYMATRNLPPWGHCMGDLLHDGWGLPDFIELKKVGRINVRLNFMKMCVPW